MYNSLKTTFSINIINWEVKLNYQVKDGDSQICIHVCTYLLYTQNLGNIFQSVSVQQPSHSERDVNRLYGQEITRLANKYFKDYFSNKLLESDLLIQ
jgi:hypothetical protein